MAELAGNFEASTSLFHGEFPFHFWVREFSGRKRDSKGGATFTWLYAAPNADASLMSFDDGL